LRLLAEEEESGGASGSDIVEMNDVRKVIGRGGNGVQELEESGVGAFFRNETSFGLSEAFTLDLLERFQGLEESALVGSGVALEQIEEIGLECLGLEGLILTAADSLQTPMGLGHFFHQQSLGWRRRPMLFEQRMPEILKLGGVFAWQNHFAGGEAVGSGVHGRSRFAFRGARTGLHSFGVLCF
jgi:hypothetical protein